jgi:hypothetical protein
MERRRRGTAALVMVAVALGVGRPATPLGDGAVIQVSDPRRVCLDAAGTAGG